MMQTIKQQKIKKLAAKYNEAQMPMYLSYPVLGFWKTELSMDDYTKACQTLHAPFFYFHFPFCPKACFYCACFKEVSTDNRKIEIYLQYMQKEIRQKFPFISNRFKKSIRHLHWGGGTPTCLTCRQIETTFSEIMKYRTLADDASSSISIEAYPDETFLTRQKLSLLRSLGFNEISLGVQEFDERVQATINRDVKPDAVQRIIDNCKALGFRVHVDLCYGLPFQGEKQLYKTIQQIIEMDPDRVALYMYSHHPHVFPMQRKIKFDSLPSLYQRQMQAEQAEAVFFQNGFIKVGYDHFVKPGNTLAVAAKSREVVRDFMGISVADRKEFIGFGCSAISFAGNTFFQNTTDLEAYYNQLDNGRLPLEKDKGHPLSRDDCIRNRIIQHQIMGNFEVNKKSIQQEFKIDFDQYFEKELEDLRELTADGLLKKQNRDLYAVTDSGRLFLRRIAYAFDNYYNHVQWDDHE